MTTIQFKRNNPVLLSKRSLIILVLLLPVSSFTFLIPNHHRNYYNHYHFPCAKPPCASMGMVASSHDTISAKVSYDVIYQKVLRPPRKESFGQFLPSLIDYIHMDYRLPRDLPMLYDLTKMEYHNNEEEDNSCFKNSILSIDSPLSRDSRQTQMDVEVVGIYPDNTEGKESNIPTMVMVIVKKLKQLPEEEQVGGGGIVGKDIMTTRLFEDSEKRILKSLDYGLDSFVEGKFQGTVSSSPDGSGKRKSLETSNAALEEERDDFIASNFEGFDENHSLDEFLVKKNKNAVSNIERDREGNVVIDTSSSSVQSKRPPENEEKATQGINEKTNRACRDEIGTSDDFAVTEAKRVAALESKFSKSGDFAVDAAKAVANNTSLMENNDGNFAINSAKAISKKITKRAKLEKCVVDVMPNDAIPQKSRNSEIRIKETSVAGNKVSLNSLPLGKMNKPGTFRVSISSPKEYAKKLVSERKRVQKKDVLDAKSNGGKRQEAKHRVTITRGKDEVQTGKKINLVMDTSIDPNLVTEEEKQRSFDNIMYDSMKERVSATEKNNGTHTKTNAQIEEDEMNAAVDLMPDDPLGGGMTPEELLKDVLKFGEETEKEEMKGFGYGAFAMSKELTENESASPDVLYKDIYSKKQSSNEKMSAAEELKQIFAAGESIAEGRISCPEATSSSSNVGVKTLARDTSASDEKIEELIEADKTIPRNARSLDEDLAELEVRVGRRPNSDAPGTNPLFDVFSGPEVYNPNVDPETAVNWPGAQYGTRTDINLPPALATAINNAQFAADVISKMAIEQDQNTSDSKKRYTINGKEISEKQVKSLQKCVEESVKAELIQDPMKYLEEKSRLQMVLDELRSQPNERFQEIVGNYKDLLLSENFVMLIRDRLQYMATETIKRKRNFSSANKMEAEYELERNILGRLVTTAQMLLKEVQAVGSALEATQLELIRSICAVAMDPNHTTEEETAVALTDAVRDMRPLLDETFVGYLKYAIAEEEGKLARMGVLDDPEHNRWLFVLKIVQQGVYKELEIGVKRHIDHIGYVLRMETKEERKMLLAKLIDDMPSMDVRPFVKVVNNIAASLGASVKGEFDSSIIGSMTKEILQLRRDVQELLPPERIKVMSKDADEWAARQRSHLLEQQNLTQQRLKGAHETKSFDSERQGRGEMEYMSSDFS